MNIQQIMHRSPLRCRATDVLAVPAELMWKNDIGSIPVVDEVNRPIAMITDRDIAMCTFLTGAVIWRTPVSQAMSKSIVTIEEDASMEDAEELMRAHSVRRLPVVDDAGRLMGVISLGDLSRHAAGSAGRADSVGVARTVAAICAPRNARPAQATA